MKQKSKKIKMKKQTVLREIRDLRKILHVDSMSMYSGDCPPDQWSSFPSLYLTFIPSYFPVLFLLLNCFVIYCNGYSG